MPIDPRIAGEVGDTGTGQRGGYGGQSMTGVLKDALDLRRVGEQVKAEQRKREEEQAERDAFSQHMNADGPDYDAIVNTLAVKAPQKAMALRLLVDKQRQSAATTEENKLKLEQQKLEMAMQTMNGVTPETYAQRLEIVRSINPKTADLLGAEYNEARINELRNIGMKSLDYIKQQQEGLKKWSDGDLAGGYWQTMATATTPERVDEIKKHGKAMGVPADIIAMTPEFNPMNPEAFRQTVIDMSLSPEKKQELKLKQDSEDRQINESKARIKNMEDDNARAVEAAAEAKLKAEAAAKALADYREATLNLRRAQGGRNTPGADDPLLPNGVKQYLQDLRGQNLSFEQAKQQVKNASTMLVKDHPKLDNGKLFDFLDTLYGKRNATDIPVRPDIPTTVAPGAGDRRKVGNAISTKDQVVKTPNGKEFKIGSTRQLKDGTTVEIISVDPVTGAVETRPVKVK